MFGKSNWALFDEINSKVVVDNVSNYTGCIYFSAWFLERSSGSVGAPLMHFCTPQTNLLTTTPIDYLNIIYLMIFVIINNTKYKYNESKSTIHFSGGDKSLQKKICPGSL